MRDDKDNVLFVSTITLLTPCQGFKAQDGLIFSCFADTLLLIVPHGHMCKFLIVGEEFIFMRKIFWIPEYFLVFFGSLVFTSRLFLMPIRPLSRSGLMVAVSPDLA